jgi:hypothetical protein
MILGQEVMEENNYPTFCWKSTKKAILAHTCTGAFSIRSVSDTIFAMLSSPETAADYLWSADQSLRNTDLCVRVLHADTVPPSLWCIKYVKNTWFV